MNNYQEEFYNNIDFTPLYNYINKLLNIELHYEKELHKLYEMSVIIKSVENIVNEDNIIALAWKDFRIKGEGNIFARIGNDEDPKIHFSGVIDFDYNHHDGGHNGATICYFDYTQENGWKFQTEKERYKER